MGVRPLIPSSGEKSIYFTFHRAGENQVSFTTRLCHWLFRRTMGLAPGLRIRYEQRFPKLIHAKLGNFFLHR
jgi:hypothetical protein